MSLCPIRRRDCTAYLHGVTVKQIATALAAGLLLAPHLVLAHSGGLDKFGCHRNSRTGDYHCHQPSTPTPPPTTPPAPPVTPIDRRISLVTPEPFAEQHVGTMSPAVIIVIANSGSASVSVTSIVSSNSNEFRIANSDCSVIPISTTCSFQVSFLPATAGPRSASIGIISNASGSPHSVTVAGIGSLPSLSVRLIEYYNAGFDHYFITSGANEVAALDAGQFTGWTRTGLEIPATRLGVADSSLPVWRFFSAAFAPRSSHFYTTSETECAAIKQNQHWQFEGMVFNLRVPDLDGNCAVGTQPIYRLYNGGKSGAPNHRYTMSLVVRDHMLALGWIPEGYGAAGVMMCAPNGA